MELYLSNKATIRGSTILNLGKHSDGSVLGKLEFSGKSERPEAGAMRTDANSWEISKIIEECRISSKILGNPWKTRGILENPLELS